MGSKQSVFRCCAVLFSFVSIFEISYSADWPTWRADASRSAASPEELPAELHPQWSIHLAALKPAWTEDARLQFDATYEPIVLGNTMFVGSSRNDSVTAIDISTGRQRWRFFTDGPVRFAPVASKGRVYFGADDGCFYCVDAEKGTQIWKFRPAPTRRKVIGNERLISVWPMRGGPVLSNDRIYFTVGVWPFEGTLLYTLDATSGDLVQVEGSESPDDAGLNYTSTTLKDLSPQGYLVASGDNLFVPCGRANLFGVNTKTGKRVSVKYSAKGLTDYHAVAVGKWLFHGDKIVNIEKQQTSSLAAHRPVIDGERVFFASKGRAVAYDLKNQMTVEKKDRRGATVKVLVPTRLWQFDESPVTTVHMKAGNRIYGHHANTVLAIDIPTADGHPTSSWKVNIEGTPSSMLAANGKLFVVTKEGGIHCFASNETEAKVYRETTETVGLKDERWVTHAADVLSQANTKDGYCLVLGIGEGNLVDELIRQSNFQIIAVDSDAEKVNALRRRLDAKGLYGTRVVAHVDNPLDFEFPPYLANLVVSEDLKTAGLEEQSAFVKRTFHALRPYGGIACFDLPAESHSSLARKVAECELPSAEVKRVGHLSTLSRVGALVGSADWTHEYGDPSNTLMSRDKVVKAPLGVLWFGGPASDGSLFYDRHQWGPSMAVVEGRMFIQGPEVFTCIDVYTGRILWQKRLAKGMTPGRRANWGPSGFHFVAVKDALYLAFPDRCVRLEPATGKEVSEFTLEDDEELWGRIRIWKDQIIAPVFQQVKDGDPLPKHLIAMDRHTGKVNWKKESAQSFAMVAIGGDKVFCYEGVLKGLYKGADKIRKDGIPQALPFLSMRALDVKSGEDLWDRTTTQVATWLAYSEEHDVLLTSNKQGIEARRGKDGEDLWSKEEKGLGFRGHPENYWDKVIIWKDKIIDQRGPGRSYSLLSGEPEVRSHPITGKPIPWEFTKEGHHCNYAIASEHLMTFRAASAGFCDLESGGTGRWVGFRSGCRNSLIPANGVLNAPNFAHGCVCSYSIFTSLALVNVPETDFWTYSTFKAGDGPVERLGINLGAEGDRKSESGTMWLDYPNVGGPSPNLPIKIVTEKPKPFRIHSTRIEGDGLKWVAASGVRGVRSITIPLATGTAKNDTKDRQFTVALYFAEPRDASEGENVFSVTMQGREIFTGFDVVKEAGGARTLVVKRLKIETADPQLTLSFVPSKGDTVLSGVEIVAEK